MGEKERLEDMYCEKFLTQREIADKLGISATHVGRLFKKYKIKARDDSESKLKEKKKPTKKELYNLYWIQQMPSYKIGKMLGFPDKTIVVWLKRYEIPTRGLSESKFKLRIDKKELEDLYLKQKLSTNQIAEKFNLKDTEYVRRKLIYYGIERRDSIEVRSIMVNLKPSPELAYVLGVMKGDGSILPGDSTICLGTIDLIFAESFKRALKKLGFNANIKRYKRLDNRQQMYHTKANSKQFCLWYKGLSLNDIENFVFKDEDMIKEFIRGFYESEGYGRTYINLSNSNKELLEMIIRLLKKLDLDLKISKGKINKKHPNWKKMYEIHNYNQKNYHRFFELIRPLIKDYKYYIKKDFEEYLKIFRERYGLKKEIKLIICDEKVIKDFMEHHYPINREIPSAISIHHSDNYSEIYIQPFGLNKYYGFNNKKLLKWILLHELSHCIEPKNEYGVDLNERLANEAEEFADSFMEKEFPEEMILYKKIRKRKK